MQSQVTQGSVAGKLAGDDGTVVSGVAVYLHFIAQPFSKAAPHRTDWATITDSGGAFHVDTLPEGSYTVCALLQGSTWLNPCEWKLPTPIATITKQAPVASLTITLKRGAALPIRIEDSAQLLEQHEGKSPGAGLLLGISAPGLLFRPVPPASKDSTGRNYQIVVPLNTALTLALHSSFYKINDFNGTALTRGVSAKYQISIAPGQQVSPLKFTVTGGGN